MKEIIIILESGEEIACGHARSLFSYFLGTINKVIVPIHGNKGYVLIKNMYHEGLDQYVSYKAV